MSSDGTGIGGEILAQLTDAVFALDATGLVVYWNGAAESLFSVPASVVLGNPLSECVPALRVPDPGSTGQRVVERTLQSSNGGHVTIESTITRLRDGADAPGGLLCVSRTIPGRQRRIRELARMHSLRDAGMAINSLLLTLRNEPDLVGKACDALESLSFIDGVQISLRGRQDGMLQTLVRRGTTAHDKSDFRSRLVIPLVADRQDLGVLEAYCRGEGGFPADLTDFLTEMAGDIAVGIKALRMERSLADHVLALRKTLSEAIDVVTAISEFKDPYTTGHQRRVAGLSYRLACEIGLSGVEADHIATASLVHDIGKIGVPAEILAKPGKLTTPEMELIKAHAQIGRDIMRSISFGWPLADIISQHHERMDGTGYPRGLRGDEICLEARILAVADVVEAMSSHRPYRAALGTELALAEVRAGSGTRYDARIVDACIRVFTEQGFVF